MSQADMSRRVGVLMNTMTIRTLDANQRQDFVREVESSSKLEDLSGGTQMLILQAEKELSGDGWNWDPVAGRMVHAPVDQSGVKESRSRIIVRGKINPN